MTIRIAMWSGPRNLSTAMMRSFERRADTFVSDEPFYGAFLNDTGADHPMRDEVIAAMDCDWRSVMQTLRGDALDNSPVWYQKHMWHHMAMRIVMGAAVLARPVRRVLRRVSAVALPSGRGN